MKLPESGPGDLTHRHRLEPGPYRWSMPVTWGDCDPAQIAYTANIPGFGLRALEAWFKACVGAGFYEMNIDLGVGTPFVELKCTFIAPVTPRAPLDVEVTVTRIGRSSLRTRVLGSQSTRICFDAMYACVFVDAVAHRPIPIPAGMRRNITDFAAAQGTAFEDASERDA